MAVNTHGITPTSVLLDSLPFAEGVVTSTSKGLNTAMLEGWILRASGILNSILRRNQIDPDTLTDDAKELVREGITAYTAAKALEKREYPREQIDRQWELFGSIRKTLRDTPGDLTPSYDASVTVSSNLDDRPRTPRTFGGKQW